MKNTKLACVLAGTIGVIGAIVVCSTFIYTAPITITVNDVYKSYSSYKQAEKEYQEAEASYISLYKVCPDAQVEPSYHNSRGERIYTSISSEKNNITIGQFNSPTYVRISCESNLNSGVTEFEYISKKENSFLASSKMIMKETMYKYKENQFLTQERKRIAKEIGYE